MASTVPSFVELAKRTSKRVILSYIFDWIVIIFIAALGGIFSIIKGTATRHAFSLTDPGISYPHNPDTVSVTALAVAAVCGPAAITFLTSMIFVPGPTAQRSTPRGLVWRRKLWEWNTAWMGLALSLASSVMITQGLKNAAGAPRPHLLAVCNPDTSPASIAKWRVGGLGGNTLDTAIPIMVTWEICRPSNLDDLRDAFSSWPSGHSSLSWAGFLYLTLYVCSKFGVTIPFLPYTSAERRYCSTFGEKADGKSTPPRNHAAAPPVYLVLLAAVPIGGAVYICVSRWFDYHHRAFDIISGALIGIASAWFSFRLYHLPIRSGSGWAWGARSKDRAFFLGVGRHNYVGEEGMEVSSNVDRPLDVESAPANSFEMQKPHPPSEPEHSEASRHSD